MRLLPSDYPKLFQDRRLAETLQRQAEKIELILDELNDDSLLATPTEDLVEHIHDQVYVPPVEIYKDRGVSRVPVAIGRYQDDDGRYHLLEKWFPV